MHTTLFFHAGASAPQIQSNLEKRTTMTARKRNRRCTSSIPSHHASKTSSFQSAYADEYVTVQPATPWTEAVVLPPVVKDNAAAPSFYQRWHSQAVQLSCAALLSLTFLLHDPQPAFSAVPLSSPTIDNNTPFLDLAHVVPAGKLQGIQTQITQLEKDTGYRVRVLTRFGPSNDPSVEEIRAGWNVDGRTVVVFIDPSSPNIMNFKFGTGVQKLLPRAFFTELQSRYGNMFFVRENGEAAAVDGMLTALDVCLRREGGCAVPPGLPEEQYLFTLGTSVTGGLILGAVLRIEPQGFVKRRWVYGLLFAPLWATLAINFGIGPVVSRTDDVLPVAANVAATVVAALLIYFYPQAAKATGLTVDSGDDSDGDGF